MPAEYPLVQVASAEQWRAWLHEHHATSVGVWLVTWKRGRGPDVPYDDIVDEALCFGWIDSRPGTVDAARSRRLLTPRRPGSNWSRVNKDRVARLAAAGRMAPSGLAAVAAAKADGTWTALDAVEALIEPAGLATALDADPAARRHWDAFPRSARRAILEWIAAARTEPTRRRRIETTAAEAAQNRRANQWQPKTR